MIELVKASRLENNRAVISEVSASFGQSGLVSVLSEREVELRCFLNLLNGSQKLSSGSRRAPGRREFAAAIGLEGVVPHLSVRKNVRIGLLRMRRRSQEEQARLWRGLKLEQAASLPAASLAPSDQSALVLLRCLQQDVSVYQISSCLQNLRPDVIEFAWNELRDVSTAGKLVFVATQNEHFGPKTDRFIVLRDGAISLDKSASETNPEEVCRQMVNNSAHLQYLVSESLTRRANQSVDPVDLCCHTSELLRDICHRRVRCAIVTGPEYTEQAVDGDGQAVDASSWREFLAPASRNRTVATNQFDFHSYTCDEYVILFVLDECVEKSFLCEMIFFEFDRAAAVQHQLRTLRQTVEHVGRLDSLGRIAGGVAHDVNNSIAPVMISVDMLQAEKNMSEEATIHLDVISKSVARMEKLSQRLVEFSRNGRMRTAVVDLGEVVLDTARILESTIGRNITVTTRIGNGRVIVMGDRQQLENAIINLGINSRDAMPEGGKLLLELQLDTHEQNARLTIADTGCGMSPSTRRRAFEPFFTTKGAAGTGLGLSSVSGIISEHDGGIRIASTSDEGTTFEIKLPLSAEVPEVRSALPIHNGSGELVMIVDDEQIVRETLARLTTQLGYSVVCADGPEVALAVFRERHEEIGLTLMDISMPGMSGVDCLLELRNISRNICVVLMTGHTEMQLDLPELGEAGLRGILRKPFSKEKLAETLFEHLANSSVSK